jgi:hypothetical protein
MLFSLLLSIINIAMTITAKTNKSIKDLIKVRNCAYVMMTRDGKIGRRFIFKDGKYSSDKVLKDYDLAFVFKNADVGFKTLALGGQTGITEAINNWNLKLIGNIDISNFFQIMIGVSMGMMKRT